MDKPKVIIYTDGACSGNPGPGGYAAIIMMGESKKEIFGASKNTTNNQMELMAAIEGLKALTKPCVVELYSDSAYLVNAYEKGWVSSWKKNGWKNASKEPVKNKELWEEMESLREIHDVSFIKVKGHADNVYNNRCDELAVNAIKKLEKGEIDYLEEDEINKVFGSYPTLETKRANIRLFKETDVNDLFKYCSDPLVTKYMVFDTYTDIKEAHERIKYCIEQNEKLERPLLWAIEDKETHKLIGSIDFVKWYISHKNAEIGYVLNRKYWNKGIMTEVLSEVIKFGFEKMNLNRIEIYCDERNIGSARVLEKNDLKYEGTFRQRMYIKNEFVNLRCYSILKEEYFKNS